VCLVTNVQGHREKKKKYNPTTTPQSTQEFSCLTGGSKEAKEKNKNR
jgi:hypothetical protein